ncbi:MAG TPA: flagellar biosynthesis anti-sigma factor FlgM [Allosphingosinicella sp.]
MIDGVGKSGLGRIDLQKGQVAKSAATAKAGDAVAQGQNGGASSLVADIASAGPPVDADKIAALRAAIAEGRYPVDPDKIAERMLALDLPLKGEQ